VRSQKSQGGHLVPLDKQALANLELHNPQLCAPINYGLFAAGVFFFLFGRSTRAPAARRRKHGQPK